ncbi:hypothetical protein ACHAXR_012324 [Thalassiosira sp. AJA248-18]
MSSSQLEHVFYNAHSKVSHYILRHTSHRLRSVVEHAVLGLAVCGFCVVILSHRTFVHREDIESINREDHGSVACDSNNEDGGYGLLGLGFIGEGRGVSMYSIVVQLIRSGYAWMVSSKRQPLSNSMNGTSSWSVGKKIPGSCLKSISGFSENADVNHILLQYDEDERSFDSRAFTIHRGGNEYEQIVSGSPIPANNNTHQFHSCIIGAPPPESARQRTLFGFAKQDQIQQHLQDCSPEIISFLAHHGHLPKDFNGTFSEPHPTITDQQYSPIVYSYSHSQGFLRLQPSLQHRHNISTQFIIASSTDPHCFGEPFAQNIIFRLGLGPDTVILNWILGLQHIIARPRFVYHWKTRKELDLDAFDMDRYAFSSKSSASRSNGGARETIMQTTSTSSLLPLAFINNIIARIEKYPLYRFLRFLTFKLLVLLSTLLIFFLTTSLVSFTFQETQDRMVEFTLQLQTRVRARMPLGGLILGHVLENLVFVPIMIGMIFFLIEFYGGDTFLAFMVISMVWICEVFSAISIRSAQGMHFFPRVFFLYFTLFHVYFFSCPIGFTYASLASTILFLVHTMLFFWNRYELPALHAGLVSPQSPRMARLGMDRVGEANGAIVSPPRIQPSSMQVPRLHNQQPPSIPRVSDLDGSSTFTAPTVPLSSTIDFTPQSDQQSLLNPSYPSAMRSYVAVASTSLLSIRSMASIQSSSSLAAERNSPNFIFQGGYNFNDSEGVGDGEEDSYIARVMPSS